MIACSNRVWSTLSKTFYSSKTSDIAQKKGLCWLSPAATFCGSGSGAEVVNNCLPSACWESAGVGWRLSARS